MKHVHPFVAALGLSLVLPLGTVMAGPAQALTMPAVSADKTFKVDVDGEGHKDKFSLYYDDSTMLVKVTTAKKKKSSFRTDGGEYNQHYHKAGSLDGAKGKELIFITDEEVVVTYEVVTWRKNRLTKAKPPMVRNRNDEVTGWTPGEEDLSGFRFFTSKGKRYVDATYLWLNEEDEAWEGATYRSVWSSSAWHLKHTTDLRYLTDARAEAYAGFHGI